jgi:hypothetical protein
MLGLEGALSGLPAEKSRQLRDLMEVVHYIPCMLAWKETCDESILVSALQAYDEKWSSSLADLYARVRSGEMGDAAPVEILRRSAEENWDLGESTTDSRLWASPLGRFVAAFRNSVQGLTALHWLALFAARRALACWQLYCDGTIPLEGVRTAEQFLRGQVPSSALRTFMEPARPSYRGTPIVDCRECDTGSAAKAVACMARLIADGNLRDLAICLSVADMAFDQSPLVHRDQFQRWLIEVAIPVALEERDLTDEEASRFREYSLAELDTDRERN